MNRRVVAVVLLVFYGGVALFGPEVHALFGGDDHGADDHGGESAVASLSDDNGLGKPSGPAFRSPGHDEENCPVCKLLSMPQAAAMATGQEQAVEIVRDHVQWPCSSPVASPSTPFLIRGPPHSI